MFKYSQSLSWRVSTTLLFFIVGTFLPLGALAQNDSDDDQEDVFELSPFVVDADRDMPYLAASTLAGTRIRTDLRDVGSAISVLTEEFLDDLGATDNESVLAYALNTEVGGPLGNFSGGVSGGSTPREQGLFASPSTNTRVRGLSQADNTRNFYRTDVPWDSYVVSRVDLQRGPNAILFGLGSPAGVVNATLDSANPRNNSGEVQIRIDEFGSFRSSINVNRVIIEDVLGIRVAGLMDRQKFRQDPTFEDDDRLFIAAKFAPKSLNQGRTRVELSGNFEKGDVLSNRPRSLPPQDAISGFWRPRSENGVNKQTFDFYLDNDIMDSNQDPPFVGGIQSLFENSPTFMHNSNGVSDTYGWFHIAHVDYGAFTPDGRIIDNINVPSSDGGVFGDNRRQHVLQQTVFWARQDNVPYANDGFWENAMIGDPRIFNFYDLLPEGDNKREWNEWETAELDLSATFFDDSIGFNVGYFNQELNRGQYGVQGWDNRIFIDINENLQDRSSNPNVGRAFINHNLSSTGTGERWVDRDSLRAQVFVQEDFEGFEGFLGTLLGNQRLTGLYLEDNEQTDARSYNLTGFEPAYEALFGPDTNAGRINPVFRSYISGDLRGLNGPTEAKLTNVQQDVIPQSGPVPVTYFNTTWTAGSGVDPTDPWVNPLDGAAERSFQSWNPANYQGWTTEPYEIYFFKDDVTVRGTNLSARDYLTSNAVLSDAEIESKVFVYQGFFWNDSVVFTYGYREDESVSRRLTAGDLRYTFGHTLVGGTDFGLYDITDTRPEAYHLESDDASTFMLETETTNWSVALHANRIIPALDRKLPFDISFYYNEGENFQPAAGRLDAFARPLPPPGGSTVDKSFLIATKDNKYSLRVTKFRTEVTNQNTTGDIGAMWALQQTLFAPTIARNNFRPVSEGGSGSWSTDNHPDPERLVNVILPAWDQFEIDLNNQFPEFVDAWIWRGGWAPSDSATNARRPAGHVFTEDAISEGWEYEFTANPTKNWRITINASKVEAIRDKVPGQTFLDVSQFIDNAMVNTAVGDMPVWWSASPGVATNIYPTFRGDYLKLIALNGQTQPEVRKWRINMITNYSISDGRFKGLSLGGSLRYESDTVLDYLPLDNPDGSVSVDIENPVRGDKNTNIGLHVSYRWDLTKDIDCRVQLNAYNVFGKNELVPISLDPWGGPLGYRIREGRSFALTTTFTF